MCYLQNPKIPRKYWVYFDVVDAERANNYFLTFSKAVWPLTDQMMPRILVEVMGSYILDETIPHPFLCEIICEYLYVLN